jgi:hypothetical protein
MGHLTAVEPDGLGVVDQDVVDWHGVFLACDWHEARLDARPSFRSQVGGERFAGISK